MQTSTDRLRALIQCMPFEKKAFLSLNVYDQEKIVQQVIADSWPKKPTITFLWSRVAQYMLVYHADLVRHYIAKAVALTQGSTCCPFTPTKRHPSSYPIGSQRAPRPGVQKPLYSPPLSAEDALRVVTRSAHHSM